MLQGQQARAGGADRGTFEVRRAGEMKTAVYHCTTATEARDRANLYYIASPTARVIKEEKPARRIVIESKRGPQAIFQY